MNSLHTTAAGSHELSPPELARREVPSGARLAENRRETEPLQARMVALQEELDWLSYRLYGLTGEDDPSLEWPMTESELPGLKLGERAFEVAMARQMEAGELQTAWFERHEEEPLIRCRHAHCDEGEPALFVEIHPGAEEVEFCVPAPGRLVVSAKTSTAGPGSPPPGAN